MTSHNIISSKDSGSSKGWRGSVLVMAMSGVMLLGLQACATTDMPSPKYPVYMQDKPAEATAPASANDTPAPTNAPPVITLPASSGKITTTELAPPPPPPPPAEVSPSVTPVATTPALVAAAPTAPVKDSRAAYVYILASHDTLYGVSRRFGVPVKTLYDINGFEPTATLKIGERILLPEGATDKGVEEHANGSGMVRLSTALASGAPSPAPKPAATPLVAKPVAVASVPAKPPVTTPPVTAAPKTTTTTVTTPKTTTTTTTTVSVAPAPKSPVTVPATTPVKPATKPVTSPSTAVAGFPSNTQISQMSRGLFAWPVKGKVIVPFGQLAPNVRNDGINISATSGTEVRAAADGVVVYEGDQVKELGNTIYVKHPNGWYTGYSHLLSMNVSNNEAVKKGQVIGTVGDTGTIDQPQLHFEVRYTPSTDIARPIDPNLVLP